MNQEAFIEQLQNDQIVTAVGAAEAKTSGEIRVFISRKETTDPLVTAQAEFNRLGMVKTAERNGVLIFVAPRSQKFAIIGDEGIHRHCGEKFWSEVAAQMTTHFKKSEFTQGIVHAIDKAGLLLAKHFPHRADDKNELPDTVERD